MPELTYYKRKILTKLVCYKTNIFKIFLFCTTPHKMYMASVVVDRGGFFAPPPEPGPV